ncbi:MAG: aminotransferase class IV, partial [Pseudomonadota bacterium]
ITRQRTIDLLRADGVAVEETTLSVADFMDADEIFSTGNNSKIVAINRLEDREMQPGPMMFKARELYWDWAHSKS